MAAAETEQQQQLRSLRDFLRTYNRLTERCFLRCVAGLAQRGLSRDEERCLDGCAGRRLRSGQRLLGAYVQLMPALLQRRADERQETPPDQPPPGAPA